MHWGVLGSYQAISKGGHISPRAMSVGAGWGSGWGTPLFNCVLFHSGQWRVGTCVNFTWSPGTNILPQRKELTGAKNGHNVNSFSCPEVEFVHPLDLDSMTCFGWPMGLQQTRHKRRIEKCFCTGVCLLLLLLLETLLPPWEQAHGERPGYPRAGPRQVSEAIPDQPAPAKPA